MKISKNILTGIVSATVFALVGGQAVAKSVEGSNIDHGYDSVGYVSMAGTKGAIRNDNKTFGYGATGYVSMAKDVDTISPSKANTVRLDGDANLLHGYGNTGYDSLANTTTTITGTQQGVNHTEPMHGYDSTSYSPEWIS
jgi:hypothetical protein